MVIRVDTREHTSIYSTIDLHWKWKNHKKCKWIFWITRQLFPIILVQGPHADPLWKKHCTCMSNKKIISCFQYPVKTTAFTVSRKSFHTGCSNLTSMFLCGYISTNDVFFYSSQGRIQDFVLGGTKVGESLGTA